MPEEEEQFKPKSEVREAEHTDTIFVEKAPASIVISDPNSLVLEREHTVASVTPDPLVGTLLGGRYQILSLIGKGATSSVYKAMDSNLQHPVAVKVLHSHLTSDAEIVTRFNQEIRTASLITHPYVVTIHDCSTSAGGQPYFVMSYVEGVSLQQMIQESGWIPVGRAVSIFSQVCAALCAAHEKGIVHRDLKPSNIMVERTADGQDLVKVLDFGVAKILPLQGETVQKLTQTGEMLGSLLYMSPEQCLDQDVDARSDIYSLGCVLYEAVTGKPPLCGRTAFETMNKHMSEMPEKLAKVRPDVHYPQALEQVVRKAIAKRPENRYQSASLFLDDLQALPAMASVSPLPNDLNSEHDSNLQANSQSHFSMPALAQRELDRELRTCQVLVSCMVAIGLTAATLFLIILVSNYGFGLIGFPLGVSMLAIIFLMPVLLLFGFWEKIRRPIPRISHAVSIISTVRPTKVLVTRVEKAPDDFYRYWIDVPAVEGDHSPKARFQIQRTGPLLPRNDTSGDLAFWTSLCSASKLAGVGQSSVFPILCDAYIDEKSQKPVAIAINGILTWVVT